MADRPQTNPFPAGSKVLYPDLWADRKEAHSALKRTFEIAYGSQEPMMIQVRGEYGSGKTHALRYLEYQIREGWGRMRGFPIYVETPGEDLSEFFNNFFFAIKMDNIVSSMKQLFAQVILSRSAQLGTETSAEAIVSNLDPARLSYDLKQLLVDLFKGTGFSLRGADVSDHWEYLATALSSLPLGGDRQFAAAKWLTFQRLYQNDKDLLRIPVDNTQSPAYVAATMVAIIRLLARAKNYPKVVLLFDELEEIRTSGELEDLAQCLRHLVDSGLPELIIVLGTSISADDIFRDVSQALIRRIHMTVDLNPLIPSDLIQLVDKYMALSPEGKESWLTEESASVFCNATAGRISDLLRILNRAYDISLQKGWKRIDSAGKAEEVLRDARKLGFPETFLEPEVEPAKPKKAEEA